MAASLNLLPELRRYHGWGTATGISRLIILAFLLIFMPATPAHSQLKRVHLELVLAIDTSTSVDSTEYILQRRGLAEAFRHKDVINAIQSLGPLGIAVSLVQWSASKRQRTAIDWLVVKDSVSSRAFARKLDLVDREFQGMTDIGGAVRFSSNSLLSNAYRGDRLVIDVSGDGTSNPDGDAAARDYAISNGITTNALVIFSTEYDLGSLANIELKTHFSNFVIGGVGAFLMSANDFVDYKQAIRKKLVREIIGPNYANLIGGFATQ